MDKLTIFDEDFGIKIKKKLLDIKMSQSELAELTGISKGYMSEVLGEKKGSLDIKAKILKSVKEYESRCVVNKK